MKRIIILLALLWWSPALAQLPLTGAGAGGGAGGGGFSLTFGSIVSSTTTSTTVNYSMSWASGNTRVIACIGTFASGPTVSSVTFPGAISATAVVTGGGGTNVPATCWQSNSAVSGTSGTVTVVYTVAPIDNSVMATYSLNTTTTAASSTQSGTAPSGTSVTPSALVVPTGGGGLAFCAEYANGTPSFTNATTDGSAGTGHSLLATGGHTTSTGSITVTCNTGGSATVVSVALAAWGP